MKNRGVKITTILLLVMTVLSLSACSASNFWGYFTGNFPDLPKEPPQEIVINQGTIQTQTGGLADVIESIRPSVVDLTVVYYYNQAFVSGSVYTKTYEELAVVCKKDDEGVYFLTTHQGTKDGENISVSGSVYVFSRVEIYVKIGTKKIYAQKITSIESTDTTLLFISKDNLGEYYDDLITTKFPEIYQPIKGSTVIAFSNPYGVYNGTVTKGIVSSEREVSVDGQAYTLLQTDAALSFMSSGIVFNESGELMGLLFAKVSGNYEGLSFAMPIDQIISSYHQKGLLEDIVVGENENE